MLGKAKGKLNNFFKPIDLTTGKVSTVLIKFALPIIISYLLQQFYTLADAIICGQNLGVNQVAGVNDTLSLSFIFLQFAIGCTAGFSVISSNKIGEKNLEETRRSFATQIILCAFLSLVITAISLALINPLLSMIGVTKSESPTNQEVYKSAYSYIFIIFSGISAQFFYNLICCVLRSVGDSITPLIFLFFSSVLNIFLDLLFIKTFKMGVEGAALATVISQGISAIACFSYTFVKYKDLRLKKSDFKISFKDAIAHLKQGVPLGFQFSVLAFGLIAMQNGVVAFDKTPEGIMVNGTPAQNGYSSANRIIGFMMVPFNALGTAMIAFCGQNDGAGNKERIKKGFNQGILITLVLTLIVTSIGGLLSINGAYQYIFLSKDKISQTSIKYGNLTLYADLPTYFILGALIFYRSGIQGLGKSLFPLLAGIVELLARIATCFILPVAINGGPINSTAKDAAFFFLCFADPAAWIAATLLLLYPVIKYVYLTKDENLSVIEKT